jgi:hypothetical protein
MSIKNEYYRDWSDKEIISLTLTCLLIKVTTNC